MISGKKKRLICLVMVFCLCFIAAAVIIPAINNSRTYRKYTLGTGYYSIAVYPPHEKEENVKSATLDKITEEEAFSMKVFADYLPSMLIQKYNFKSAMLYCTTMKNGAKYYLLRITYADDNYVDTEPIYVDGGQLAKDPALGRLFTVDFLNYEPGSDSAKEYMYNAEEITEELLDEIGGRRFFVSYGDVYVAMSQQDLSAAEVLDFLQAIG